MTDGKNNRVIHIDRNKPFHPEMLYTIGQRCAWNFAQWRVVEENSRSTSIADLHVGQITLYSALAKGERFLLGNEFLRRFKMTGGVGLDAKFFYAFAKQPPLVPEIWEYKNVFFPSTILQLPNGERVILCIHSHNTETHRGFDYRALNREFGPDDVFASMFWRHQ